MTSSTTVTLLILPVYWEGRSTPQRKLDNDCARGMYTTNIRVILVHAPINRWFIRQLTEPSYRLANRPKTAVCLEIILLVWHGPTIALYSGR